MQRRRKNSILFFFFWCFGSYIGALYIGQQITQEEGTPGSSRPGVSITLGRYSAERLVRFFQGNALLGTVQR